MVEQSEVLQTRFAPLASLAASLALGPRGAFFSVIL